MSSEGLMDGLRLEESDTSIESILTTHDSDLMTILSSTCIYIGSTWS
jgi:hypothetical protein